MKRAAQTEADLRLPLFDEDLEIAEGFPAAVRALHAQITSADAIIIATPEYNKALPGVFCAGEMLDWEAPTGGYLLTACFASGRAAAQGMLQWLAAPR